MPTLDAAVSLTQVDHVAVVIGDDLEFNMTGFFDIFFNVDIRDAKGFFCLRLGGHERADQAYVIVANAHTAAAAAGGGLDDDRVFDTSGNF